MSIVKLGFAMIVSLLAPFSQQKYEHAYTGSIASLRYRTDLAPRYPKAEIELTVTQGDSVFGRFHLIEPATSWIGLVPEGTFRGKLTPVVGEKSFGLKSSSGFESEALCEFVGGGEIKLSRSKGGKNFVAQFGLRDRFVFNTVEVLR